MRQFGKSWIDLGVLALLGALAAPLACGGVSETGAPNRCLPACVGGNGGRDGGFYGDGSLFYTGGRDGGRYTGDGSITGVDDGSDIGTSGGIGYFDGAPDEAGAAGTLNGRGGGSGAHGGSGGGPFVDGYISVDGSFFVDGH